MRNFGNRSEKPLDFNRAQLEANAIQGQLKESEGHIGPYTAEEYEQASKVVDALIAQLGKGEGVASEILRKLKTGKQSIMHLLEEVGLSLTWQIYSGNVYSEAKEQRQREREKLLEELMTARERLNYLAKLGASDLEREDFKWLKSVVDKAVKKPNKAKKPRG